MNKSNFSKGGWTLAAALLGVVLAVGFQGATDKVGIVDIGKVLDDSNMGKASQAKINKMNSDRIELLKFMADNRVMTADQAKTLRTLWLKDSKTTVEASDFTKLQADIKKDAARANELATKASLNNEERALLDDFARRGQATEQVGHGYQQEFLQELDQVSETEKKKVLDATRTSVQTVAKAQGYTVVFESRIAPFATNDITQATLDAMNAPK